MPVFPPTGIVAVVGNSQILLRWNAVTDAASYNIYRDTVLINTVGAIVDFGKQEEYLDVGLVNDTSYSYELEVTVGVETSAKSTPPVIAIPKTILIEEDGTGVQAANTFQNLQSALDLIAGRGYTHFATINVFQENVLIRGTQSVNTSVSYNNVGTPLNIEQGLYYPRTGYPNCGGVNSVSVGFRGSNLLLATGPVEIPEDIKLASALKAEHIALSLFNSNNEFADIPGNLKKFELAKGVQLEKFQGKLETGEQKELHGQIRGLIKKLSSGSNFWLGGP